MNLLSRFLRFLAPKPAEPLDPEDEFDGFIDPEAGISKEERVERRALIREHRQLFLAEHPNHPTIEHIVDDRVFLLGLDDLYRGRMKRHESTERLACARAIAAKLRVPPADVPVEGYYTETKKLTEYFRLLRGLQAVDKELTMPVSSMREFQRLRLVASAPLYGRLVEDGRLLPRCRDPLGQALLDTMSGTDVSRWTVDNLVEQAHRIAIEPDEFSLVDLASIARDRVVLAALRGRWRCMARLTLARRATHPFLSMSGE